MLIPQWAEELQTKFGIESTQAVGQDLVRAKLPNDKGAVITTYHSAKIYLEKLSDAGFEMLILDEAHKLRNLYGVPNTPQVAIKFQHALKERLFKYVLMLTATPIQNRLWDIYSLVDLLAVARGHENPFGTEGMFARKFIEDSRTEARKLVPESKDDFRDIVYSYMSRTRRADVSLLFPERKVLLHKVRQSSEETEIFDVIKEPIQKLNRLVQISVLQALASSPQALAAQLKTSARNGTIQKEVAVEVGNIVKKMKTSAKLDGLAKLIDDLKDKQGVNWRVVIFTERRETQTTIEAFLGERGIVCGLINGDSGSRNQNTIEKFKQNPPQIHVIISTRAGSEGVNLQAANVLVNYDLPWNPMIVEQRIGRVQRLASTHANVSIYNLVLQDTFEEYIVGRLMEKLQMASQAIGDIEALLEAAGMDSEEGAGSFEEKIRELVLSSLAGQDVQESMRLAGESIEQAKEILESEEKNINEMLGGMDGAIDLGPKIPKLPPTPRSMPSSIFAIKALEKIGAILEKKSPNIYSVELEGRHQKIRFENSSENCENTTLCRPGSPFFDRLVTRISSLSLHSVEDMDNDVTNIIEKISNDWVNAFDGEPVSLKIEEVRRCFAGITILNVRITNAHDSYERLIEIECESQGTFEKEKNFLEPIGKFLEDPMSLGLPVEYLNNKAMEDVGVSEFCRFYTDRLEGEVCAAGDCAEKKKKLVEDFMPHVKISLVGLEGKLHRIIRVFVDYKIDGFDYRNQLVLEPYTESILEKPDMKKCEISEKLVPSICLGKCVISGKNVLSHLLRKSDISDRYSLAEYIVICELSGKKVISDEVKKSDVTGKNVCIDLLKTSALSGKSAEPEFFTMCEFTDVVILKSESRKSQVSGKTYRMDEELHSIVSGKFGHRQEFIFCSETDKPLLPEESERCEITGKIVMPGVLEKCQVTEKRVLPGELEKSAVSGKKALKKFFIQSSISSIFLLEEESIKSDQGKFCSVQESILCGWDGKRYHSDDIEKCKLTELSFHKKYLNDENYFTILHELLIGINNDTDGQELWDDIASKLIKILDSGRAQVRNSCFSDNKLHLACALEVKMWGGLKVRHIGLIYSVKNKTIIGHIAIGKRKGQLWLNMKNL